MRPSLHVAAVGHLDLIYTRVVTRREGFEFMNHSERAEHLALPMCGFERVAALILEPVSKGARIAHVVLWYLDVHSECMVKLLRATLPLHCIGTPCLTPCRPDWYNTSLLVQGLGCCSMGRRSHTNGYMPRCTRACAA